jgi:glycerol-3-phosphate cytidylyltransferase-like family protein
MPGFSERLSAMKSKQETADQQKKETEEGAAETAKLERGAKKSELVAERDRVNVEFAQTEQTAIEAREAVAQADAFAAEQGENLDPGAKEEIDAIKMEAEQAQQKFEELKTRLDNLNLEISAFEKSEKEDSFEKMRLDYNDISEKIAKIEESKYKTSEINSELYRLKDERNSIVREFKKQYGYDETMAQEIDQKFGYGATQTDADRIMINNYLNLELPILSRDLEFRVREGTKDTLVIIDDDSREGITNKSLLVQKRLELLEQAYAVGDVVREIPEEQREAILQEHRLDQAALNIEGFKNLFYTYSQTKTITGHGKLSPEVSAKLKASGNSVDDLMYKGERWARGIRNSLLIHKIAKERGLIE